MFNKKSDLNKMNITEILNICSDWQVHTSDGDGKTYRKDKLIYLILNAQEEFKENHPELI